MPWALDRFRGIYPAALTMFDRENSLDEEATAQHWDRLIRQGVDGLVIAGTSGEFIALENQERLRLFRLAVEISAGRVPIILSTGHYSTRLTIEMSVAAEKMGADAVIVILPYYQRPSKRAVIQHFKDVRRAVDLPIILYNNPANSACIDFSPREIVQLVGEDIVQMVKSTYETVVPIHDLVYLVGDRMAIFYGSFQAAFEAMTAGAHGWISGILNIVPGQARQMFDAVARNDAQGAFGIWKRILPLVHLYTHQLVGPVSDLAIYRSILDRWGLKGGYSRNPFYPLTREERERLRELLQQAGWLEPSPSCVSPS